MSVTETTTTACDERLARLAARGQVGRTAPTSSPVLPSTPAAITPVAAPAAAPKRRRSHAAPAGRILAAGLSTSAFIAGLASLAASPPPAWEQRGTATVPIAPAAAPEPSAAPAPEPPVQDTLFVVVQIPRTVYVDEAGNPIAKDAAPAGTADAGAGAPATPAGPEVAIPTARPAAPTEQGPTAAPTAAPVAAPEPAPGPAPAPAPEPAPPAAIAAPKPAAPPTTVACTGSTCA